MEIGTVLLYLAFVLGIFSVVLSSLHLHKRDPRLRTFARYTSLASFLIVTAAFFLLTCYFLTSDLHIEYVHDYTDSGYEWFYKLTGVWAGEKGTILLWTWIISLSLFLEDCRQRRRTLEDAISSNRDDQESDGSDGLVLFDWIRPIVMSVIVAFTYFLIVIDMFKVTDPLALSFYETGRGLNPLLQTPYMIVHPVLEFAAYGLTVIPLAAALSYLISGDRKWTEVSLLWSRVSWLLFTLGIGIGALWAYNVLGWGGYWAWDPVETANLIPWIALTAFLHAQAHNRKKGNYVYVAPLLAVLAFVFTIFATFETRSGYVVSVLHAFTGPTAQILDPGEKLIALLGTNVASNFFIKVILATLIVAGILFLWRFMKIRRREGRLKGATGLFPYAYIVFLSGLLVYVLVNVGSFVSLGLSAANALGMGNEGAGATILVLILVGTPVAWILMSSEEREEAEKDDDIAGMVNDKNLMIVTVTIFSIWFSITILLMLMGVGGLDAAVLEDRLPMILIPLFIALTACLTWRYLGRQRTLYAVALLVLAAVIGYAILPNKVVGLYIGVVLVAIVASCYRVVRTARPGKSRYGIHEIAGILLTIAGFIGMLTWSNPGRISLFIASFEPGPVYAPFGFLFSVIALVGGISALGTRSFLMSALGAIFAMLSIGYFFIALMLGFAGLAMLLYSKGSFPNPGKGGKGRGKGTGSSLRKKSLMPTLRSVGAHVIHFGVAMLVIGYVASSYLSAEKDFNPNPPGSNSLTLSAPVQFKDYAIRIVGSEGIDEDGDGLYENVKVHVSVQQKGAEVGKATMEFFWIPPQSDVESPHYMINVFVLATSYEDVYFIGYAFRTASDGWIQVREDTGRQFTSSYVTEVAFQVRSLPLMGALWGGMWIMTVGIAFVLSPQLTGRKRPPEAEEGGMDFGDREKAGGLEVDEAEEAEEMEEQTPGDEDHKARDGTDEEKDYEQIFEEELKKVEDGK